VEYEIQEALNGTSIDRNQDQRRKGRGFAQCPKSRMKPHAAVRLLRNLSIYLHSPSAEAKENLFWQQ
jgi:hypothetical protein